MNESEEGLYAELATTGSSAWARLHSDVTSQLTADVTFPDGHVERLPMPAVRGLGIDADSGGPRGGLRRRDGGLADDRHADRGGDERHQGRGQHRQPAPQLGQPARCFAVRQQRQPATFEAMQAAVTASLPDFRRWMRLKASAARLRRAGSSGGTSSRRCHTVALGDLVGRRASTWVRTAFATYSPRARRARRPCPRPALDRRRPARRQDRRSVLHAVRRRPLARAAELVGLDRLGPDHGPRARPRLSQHDARRPDAAPEATADGARRDGQHLLRDARRRRRALRGWKAPSGWRCSTSTSSDRTRSSSTSTRGSCSSPSCSPAANVARSAPASSTS